ncbi:MAG TPA: FAD-dependent thymidylate synthase [Phycisphaerales bacterium]|nr:FAD-dependent thymidylate synthase [Phycisphaerales bacterium]
MSSTATPAFTESSITRVPSESSLVDCMGGCSRMEIKIHEHGFLALVDAMPRLIPQGQTGDFAIVQAARVSYGQGTKQVNEDRGLIRYLLRHRHTTPFEMVEYKFHVSMPIFVARQWIRHRTANVNEYSARYSIMPDRFYVPPIDAIRKQSRSNRQGGEEVFRTDGGGAHVQDSLPATEEIRTAEEFLTYLKDVEGFYTRYLGLAEKGVSRELARIGLPVNMYTQWYWKSDLHNILRFLSLRMDPHAQAEIRIYASAMEALLRPLVPHTLEAWRDYEWESLRLTRLEIDAIQRWRGGGSIELESANARERAEWLTKAARLGLVKSE